MNPLHAALFGIDNYHRRDGRIINFLIIDFDNQCAFITFDSVDLKTWIHHSIRISVWTHLTSSNLKPNFNYFFFEFNSKLFEQRLDYLNKPDAANCPHDVECNIPNTHLNQNHNLHIPKTVWYWILSAIFWNFLFSLNSQPESKWKIELEKFGSCFYCIMDTYRSSTFRQGFDISLIGEKVWYHPWPSEWIPTLQHNSSAWKWSQQHWHQTKCRLKKINSQASEWWAKSQLIW